MKKILMFLCLSFVVVCTSGCNKYIKAQKNDTIYYGAYNRRDMIHADVRLYQLGSKTYCDGIIFINAPSRAITLKNDLVDAKMNLACNDGKLIDSDIKFRKGGFDRMQGTGIDQLNNIYHFEEITKSEFKEKSALKNITFINDKTDSLIQY